jgi:hypothetical protein
MKFSNIVGLFFLGTLLICSTRPAYASGWSGGMAILSLDQEAEGTLDVYPSTTPGVITGCTDNSIFYVPATNGSAPTYATLGPLILAAYLYNKTIDFDLSGCNGSHPVVVGILVTG